MTGKDKQTDTGGDDRFAEKAGELFRQSVDSIDGATSSRLNQARQAALAEVGTGRVSHGRWVRLVPVAGVAAAAAVVVVMWNGSEVIDISGPLAPVVEVSDYEILLDDENLEMLEDLEFYTWLGSGEAAGADVT